jgi:hypothetical protein
VVIQLQIRSQQRKRLPVHVIDNRRCEQESADPPTQADNRTKSGRGFSACNLGRFCRISNGWFSGGSLQSRVQQRGRILVEIDGRVRVRA